MATSDVVFSIFTDFMLNILLVILGYLLGSIPTSVWVGKRFYGIDVREAGSKNAGATNTFRVLGRKAGSIVFLVDFFKGFAAVKLALFTSYESGSAEIFGLSIALTTAAVLGHIFPIFAGFKGGKGVATAAGSAMAMATGAMFIVLGVFIVVLAITNYVSIGSMVAAISFPLTAWLLFGYPWPMILFGVIISSLIIFTHRKNIKRLINGTESKTYLIKNRKDRLG